MIEKAQSAPKASKDGITNIVAVSRGNQDIVSKLGNTAGNRIVNGIKTIDVLLPEPVWLAFTDYDQIDYLMDLHSMDTLLGAIVMND